MKIALAALLYCGLMLYDAAFSDFPILSFLCLLVVGPILGLISIGLLVTAIARRKMRPATILARLFCIAVVVFWYCELRSVGLALKPRTFAMVAKENERLAVAFMREQPPDTDVEVAGFRSPFYEIVPGGKLTTKHHAGVVSVKVPAWLNYPVFLVYVSPGSVMPYKVPTEDNMGARLGDKTARRALVLRARCRHLSWNKLTRGKNYLERRVAGPERSVFLLGTP